MSYRRLSFLDWTTCFLVAWWLAQPCAINAQEQEGQIPAPTTPTVNVPAPLGLASPQLLPASAGEERNTIGGSLAVGAAYDDNATSVNGQPREGYQYSIAPTFSFHQARAHTAWRLDYRGGVTTDGQPFETSPARQDSNALTADLQHAFSRRLLLEFREDYLRTNSPFAYIGDNQFLSAPAGLGQLNSSVATPSATRVAVISSGSVTYQLGLHSSAGLSGSFSTERFRDQATPPGLDLSLIDSRTTTGRGFYALEISEHQKIGAEYQLQDLRFDSGNARTTDQSVFLFDEIALATNMTLTLFAGPDYTHTHNSVVVVGSNGPISITPIVADTWFPVGGAMYTWTGRHAALRLSGLRAVTDGGGSTGAVRATSASAELRKDFANRWTVILGYLYSDGRLLEGPANPLSSAITLEQSSFLLQRRISEHLSVRTQYAYVQRLGTGVPAPLTTGNHNRVGLELVYEFTRPLGR